MFETLIVLNVFEQCFEHVENYCLKQLEVSLELPNVYLVELPNVFLVDSTSRGKFRISKYDSKHAWVLFKLI